VPLPRPEPGLVISYAYLWRHEKRRGQEDGVKDRPCAIAVAVQQNETDILVRVCAITHRPPENPDHAVEIPPKVKDHLGLDHERSWIIIDEINTFIWPGPDLRPIPGDPAKFDYGLLPPALFQQIIQKMQVLRTHNVLKNIARTE
jgi:hypothetical protein